ncbi:hypothetical protein PSACC_01068 [Paramicrosporidium saccamoebae]|uniref:Uncharacterized protein n=1 Tax=Paramicrosporidium saccamoebae TaxID=1246581 RepID=A0A2H9TMW5_9FUNG|nr:hypothetical protein PSACC_01068 [Paramicrosporidium saccamoebae]
MYLGVGGILIHLFQIISTQHLLVLTGFIVVDLVEISALSDNARRAAVVFVFSVVGEMVLMARFSPQIHILWVWVVLVGGSPFLRGEWKTIAAMVMLAMLVVGTALSNFRDSLPGQERLNRILKPIEWLKPEQRDLLQPWRTIMYTMSFMAYIGFCMLLVWCEVEPSEVGKAAINLFTVVPIIFVFQFRSVVRAILFATAWIGLIMYCDFMILSTCTHTDREATLIACEAAILHAIACIYTQE